MSLKSFKEENNLDQRIALAATNSKRFNGKCVTIIAEAGNGAPKMLKQVFVMPADMPFSSFSSSIRRRLEENKEQGVSLLTPDQALFYFTENNTIPPASYTLGMINKEHKNVDGLLYIIYTFESVFG